jgi:hypothetical protein
MTGRLEKGFLALSLSLSAFSKSCDFFQYSKLLLHASHVALPIYIYHN